MNNKHFFLFFVLTVVAFVSCNETDETDVKWRNANQAAYEAIQTTEGWHLLDAGDGPSDVYYKATKNGAGQVHPLQTSRVKLLIWGAYYEGTVFLTGTRTTNVPSVFEVGNSTVFPRGLSMALQQMVVGDEWEVCVPYYLGFGTGGSSSSLYDFAVQGYSTLFYTVELTEVTLYP
jgi:peptidylprolyl isomerase